MQEPVPAIVTSPDVAIAFVALFDIAGPAYSPVPVTVIAVVSAEEPTNFIVAPSSAAADIPYQICEIDSLAPLLCPVNALASTAVPPVLSPVKSHIIVAV